MKTKLNRLLALVMALMMVFQMPVSALADGRTTYQAPSFNLGDLIPVDQVSYQVAVEHYTTDGTAIAVEGAPASWTISGREVSREIDASVTINDPTYVYQYAVLQSTEKDNLAFETKGIGIDKHGMLCALNKQTGEMNSLTTKSDFVLKLFYEVVEVEPTYLEMYAQMQNMGDAELAAFLNTLTPDGFHQMILFSRSGSEVEKWTLLMSPENMKAYNNAYSGRKYYAKAAEQEVETAAVSTYALRSNANTGIMLLADEAVETEDSGVNLSKNATYKGENSAGNEVFELNLEAWTDANTAMVTKPLDIVMVLDASGSMAQNSDAYKNVGAVSSITNWGSGSSNYRYILVNGDYYRVRRESSNGSYLYYYQTSNNGTKNYIDGSTTAYQRTTRLEALKAAAANFVTGVNAKAAEMNTTARIGVIQFAGGGSSYNQASVRLSLQKGTTVDAVNNAINGLTGNGATYLDDGLDLVPNQFTQYSTSGQTRVVVIFTDGDIGYSGREDGAVNDAIASGENIRELNPEPAMYAITIAGTSTAPADLGDICGDDSHVYSSTSGMSIDDMFNQVLQDIGNNMEVQVIDYLDERFYMDDSQIAAAKAKYGDAITILKPGESGNTTGTYVIIWNTTITSTKNDGDGTQEEGESFLGTIQITRKEEFVGDNNEVTNKSGSGVYTEDGSSAIETFPQPEVNLEIRQYGKNVTEYRLLGTAEGISEEEAKLLLYSMPDYDPTLGTPDISYTWVNSNVPDEDNVLDTMADTSYIVNVVVTPSAGSSSAPGNYNDGPVTVYVEGTTDPNLTLTYKMVKPTFEGGSMELFLGEKVGDFYNVADLVTANFSAEDAAHFTTDEINAYKANIKYYVGNVELKDYVPSSTDAGTVTVTAKYNGVELGTAYITLTLHKGAIQVTKTTSDDSAATVTFEVTAANTGAATFAAANGTVTTDTPAVVGGTEFNADPSVCNTTYSLPMGTYTVTEKTVNPDNYTEDTTTTRTVTLGRVDGEFVHTGSVNLVNTRRTTSATITKADADQTVVDAGTFTMQAYLDGVAYGDPFTLAFGESETFNGLPVGANFKVVETGAPDYYTTTYSAENGITLSDAADADNTLTVTNTRGEAGAVAVKKVTVPATDTTVFAFTYSINGGEAKSISVTANDANGATIPGLLKGDKLVITETPDANYTLTGAAGTANVAGSLSGNAFTVDHVMGAGEVTFTNARNAASLTVEKTVVDDTTTARPYAFQFQAVKGDETLTFEVTWNGTAYVADTETGLLAGDTWTVTETGYKWAQADTEWIAVDTNWSVNSNDVQKLLVTGANTVSFTNTRKAAGVDVVKTINWNGTAPEAATFTLNVNVKKPGETAEDKTITVTVAADGAISYSDKSFLTNLPVGTEVTVTETDVNGWTKVEPAAYTVKAGDTNASAILTVSNTRELGNVTGNKTWVDESDKYGLRPEAITLTLKADGVIVNATPAWEKTGDTWTYTYADLPVYTAAGTLIDYDVVETQVANYQAPAYDDTKLNVTNTLDKSGTVVVTKVWDDKGLAVTHNVNDVTIGLTYGDNDTPYTDATPTTAVKTANKEYTYTFTNLPVGLTYEAVETVKVDADKYTTSANPVGVVDGKATFTNTRNMVNVTIKKASGDDAYVASQTFDMAVTADVELAAENKNFSLTFGGSKTISVPVGTIVSVAESGQPSYYKVEYSATNGTVVPVGGMTITVTNTRQTAELTLSKTSDFAQNGDTITLTVTGPVVEINDRIASINKDGKQTVTFTYNGSAWATTDSKPVLLVGQQYTITEEGTNANLFTYEVVGGANVTPADTTAVSKVVENTRKTTSLTLNKTVTNPVNDTAFTFTLTSANLAGKTFGDVVFNQDGVATVTVANNGSKTISGLPVDVVIDIVETGADNYDTTINGTPDADKATQITLAEAAANNVVTYDNTRTKTEFTLQKVCADPVPGDEFTITVTGAYAGNDSDDAERTYIFVNNAEKAAESAEDNIYAINEVVILPSLKGATYTVVETAVKSSAANYTTEYKVNETVVSAISKMYMANLDSVIITNTRDSGSVVYAKIAENVTEAAGTTFAFTATGAETGAKTATLADQGIKTVTDFKAGEEVTIAETIDPDYTATYIIVNAKTLLTDGIDEAVAEAGNTWTAATAAGVSVLAYAGDEADANKQAVVFKNVRKTGTATFYKNITTPNEVLDDETFTITVTGTMLVNGALTENASFSLTFKKADYMADGKLAGKAVPAGYELLENEPYDVTETVSGAELSTYTVGGANTDAKEYTYTAANATHTVTNAKKSGGIIVAKALSDDAMSRIAQTNETFTLRVTGTFAAGTQAAVDGYIEVILPDKSGSWSKNLTGTDGIILGQVYTVNEINAENYTNDGPKTVAAKENAETATITNTRTVGDLTVTKKAIDATEDGGLNFVFTLSTTDTRLAGKTFKTSQDGVEIIFGTESEGKVTSNEITLTVAEGAETTAAITVNGLPKGVTFTVTETKNDNYTTTNNNAAVTIKGTGDAVTVTNTRKTGDLTVTKTVDSQVAASRTYYFKVTGKFADQSTEQVLAITLPDAAQTDVTSITGLMMDGEPYTIVEYSDAACTTKVTDYTFTVNGTAASNGEYSFTYEGGAEKTFALAVENAIKDASIVLEKIAVNATEGNKIFTFFVKGLSSEKIYNNVRLTVDETGRARTTLDGFWDGESVKVIELDDTVNYTASVGTKKSTNLNNDPTFTENIVVKVTALSDPTLAGNDQAVFKNVRDTADGKITKVLNNASLTLDTEEFVITVTGDMLVNDVLTEDYEASATIAANSATAVDDVKTWSNVALTGPNGELIKLLDGETYTINEVVYNATSDTEKADYTKHYDITLPGNGTFTYQVGEEYSVINAKTPANLYVKKTTIGYVDVESFDVKVAGLFAEGTTLNSDGTVTVTIPVDGTPVAIPGVLYMETYTVVEELDKDNYYVDPGKDTVAPAAAEASDANTITVTNTREETFLTIDKVVVGTDEDKAAQYSFKVTGPNGLNKEFSLADATDVMVIENVPVGMTVTITEELTEEQKDKYTTTATANDAAVTLAGGAMTYTIDENADNLVVYTNTRNVFATSQIVKTMTAADYAAMNDTDELTITVEGQMFANGVYEKATVSTPAFGKDDFVEQADGTYAYTWTIEGKQLLEGETYTATESGNDNFTFSTVSVATGTNLTTAVITTSNALKGGAIKVQKNAIEGYAGTDSTFTVEITGTMKNAAGETVENVTITAEVTAGGDAVTVTEGTANGVAYTLIAGQTYTVTETGIDNYNVEYANRSNTAVADQNTATVTTITNTRKGAQLTLTKTVEDVSTLVEGDTFTFTVKRDTELSSAAAVQVTGEDVVSSTVNGKTITVVLKANTSATITGLFLNEPVTVTETLNTNYDLTDIASNLTGAAETATAVSGDLPAAGTATFTNARKEADVLKVKKEMSSELALSQLPTGKTFTVEVTGSAYDTDVEGWTKADNGYTYTLTFNAADIAAGTEKEVPGALYGIAYTATEIGEGTSYTPSYSTNNGAVLSKTETGTVITVTNTPVTGELKIKKLIPSYYNDLTDQQNLSGDELIGTGLATVTVTAEGFNETYTFTKANVDAGYEWSVPGVVEGQTYTVTETWQHSELEYTTQSHTTIVAGKSGSNTLATVTNDRRAYELTLNKSTDYVGDVAGDFTFAITGVFADSKGESVTREVTVTMNDAEGTAKVDNLLAGHTYSIEEKDSANYTFTVDGSETVSQNPFTYTNTDADKNGEVTLTVANTRVKADLKVTKTIDADTTLVGDEEFTLVVTGEFVDETGAVKAKELTFIFTAEDLATKSDTKTIKEAVAIDGVDMTKLYAIKGGKYSVEETAGADNFDVTYTKKDVTLAADGSDELSVKNARKATGGLTVTKVVNGYMQDTETFTVRVTGVKFLDGTEGLKGSTGEFYVEHTFTKADVDAATAWNVPGVLYGVEYTITEEGLDTATYKTEIIDPESVTMDATAQTATVTNEKQSGDLTVAKTMKDGKPVRSGDELALSVTGIFNTLTDGTVTGTEETTLALGVVYNSTTDKLGETFTLPAGYAAIVGETYTVTETITGSGDLAKVYATTFNGGENVTPVAGDGSDTRSFTFTYGEAEGQVNNVAIVNERLTAPLTLTKTLVDTTESAVNARTFTFVIAADQDLTEGDVTWDDTALLEGESVTPNYENNTVTVALYATNNATRSLIVNLPVSVTYTITETDGAGYNTAATGLTDFNDANRSGRIELMDAAEVGFTNTRGSGALVVTKNIVGYDTTRTFAFTLTETNGGKVITTFELTDDGTKTISGLATDTQYTITETDDANYTTTVSVNGGTASEALYADVAITAKSNTTVAFTNTRNTGALTVTKAMVGPVKAGDSFQLVVNGYKTFTDNGITFLVPTEVESEYATYTVTPGKATVIDGLMAGVEYTITEKLTNGEIGTNYSAKWSDDTEGFVLENVAGGTNQAVTLTNTRDAKVIEVTKAISGDVMPLTGEEFVIQVTGDEGFMDADGNQLKNGDQVITTATATFAYDAQTWTDSKLTLNVTVDGTNIVAYAYEGGTYTFTELTANGKDITAADCAWTASYSDNGALVEGEEAFTGTVTNSQKSAQLTVTKIFDGIMAEDETFEITVSGIFTDGEGTRTKTFYQSDLMTGTVAGIARNEDGTFNAWILNDVIHGNEYTVTEVIKVAGVANTLRYNEPVIATSPVKVDADQSAVRVTNTRTLTDLTVAKKATNVTSDGGEVFTFTVTSDEITLTGVIAAVLTKADGSTETKNLALTDGTVTFTLEQDQSLKLTNLPKDVTFTVTETENANYTTTNSHGDGLVGEIKLAEANTVTFTNDRKISDLYLKKIADQLINDEDTFYFTVKGNFAGENGAAVEDTRDVTVTVAWDEEANAYVGTSDKVEGALQSETYTVTEYSDADHTQLMSRYTVDVNGEANGIVNVTFDSEDATQVVTNSADTAKLTVTKTFVGPVKEGDVFVVTINAELVNGKLVVTEDAAKMVAKELTKDANGKYTATFEGLIDGQEYTLTETLKNGELTTNYTYIWTYGDETAENADLTVTGTSADQTVALENTRKHTEAALVKTMEDADEIQLKEASNDEFAITVTGQFMYEADGQWLYTAATEAVTMTISGADGLNVPVALVEDGVTYYLVYGNKYTVTEEADDAYTATVMPGDTFTFDGSDAWKSETATANIWVDNALEMKTLTVTKTVVDKSHEANALDNAFTFTYSRSDDLYGETFKLKNGQSKTFSLPADVTATIVEEANAGYTTTVQLGEEEAADALSIEGVEEGTVTFTNTRILKTDAKDTDVTKVIVGPDVETAFTFQVKKDGQPVEGVTLTIVEGKATRTATTGKDGKFTIYNGETATATNLADNYEYEFVETDLPANYDEPKVETTENGTVITNQRTEKTLQVTKTLDEMSRALDGDVFTIKVTGRFSNKPNEDQTLTFTFTKADGTLAEVNGEATKTLMQADEFEGWTGEKVFAYAGEKYSMVEEKTTNFDDPIYTDIAEGAERFEGFVENPRSRSDVNDNVTLTKVVENVSLMDETDVFTITLTGLGIEMSQNIAYADLIIDEATDTATFTWKLAEGQTLLDGETYTLAETVARDGVLLPEVAYGKTFEATGAVDEANAFVYDKPAEANANVVTVTNLPEAPEPAVEKTADQANVQTGDTVTYTVTYTNTSYSAAVVTGIVDTYDERLTFVPGSVKVDGVEAADPIVDAEAHTLTFADLIVPAATEGETELIKGKITLTYQMSVALLETDNGHAEILNTIDGDCLEQELPADNTIIGDDPVITIEKKVSDEAVYAGEGYTYTIVVTNSGLVQGVVEVTDTLDHELIKFVEFSGTNPVPGVYEETSGVETLSWKFNIPAATKNEETGEITPAVYELSFKVNTVYAVDGTIIYNKATVESDDPFGEEESNEVETVIKNPPAFILKSADKEEVNPGEQLEYTIKVVSNSLAAHPVVVEDVIPDGMTFKSFVTLGLGGVQDAENPQKLTWSFEMPAATRVDEETITPAIVEIKFTVTADALTETNVDNVTNVAELDETPEDPTDDPIPSDPVDTKIESEVWVEKYSSTNFAYVGTTFMYVFRFYNTNTAPVTGRFVDYFNEYLAVVDFEKAPGTAGYEHVVGQQIYEDNSIGIDFELPAATANADGTVTPSWVDVGVYVQALKIPTDTSTTMTIPNTGAYRDDLSNEVKNTNTVYVLVEDTYVLPVTGEWTMYLVPVGALLVLLGVALMINERRRHLQGTGR